MPILITPATEEDLPALAALYDRVTDHLAATINYPGWTKGSYPTRRDAERGLRAGGLFVARESESRCHGANRPDAASAIVGSIILLRKQEPAYATADWPSGAGDDAVFVIHTFTVDPAYRGRGAAREMLAFAEQYAKAAQAKALRLDVYEKNLPAIHLYETCGYQYVATVSLGLEDCGLDWFHLYEKPLNV